jgi:CheY-like chemotaxis protein
VAKLLIVDDEKNIRSHLAMFFRERGYEVQTAESGQQALSMFSDQGANETRTKRGQLRGRGHSVLIPRITLHAGIPPAEVSTQIAVQCLGPDLQQ